MARSPGRGGHRWRQLVAQVRREEGRTCWLCPDPIDLTLSYPHPRSFSVDHVIPLEQGGAPLDRTNVRAAHLDCNKRRGTTPARPRHSRRWLD